MIKKSVCIYGAGGHANVVAETLTASKRRIEMYFDDDPSLVEKSNGQYQPGLKLAGEQGFQVPDFPFLLAIGSNRTRADLAARLGAQFTTAIHPSAVVAASSTVGNGSVVFAQAVLQPHTQIGEHVIINTLASVDHDCRIGDFAHIAPGSTLCGNVSVGEGSHIGAGATIIEGIRIGKWSVVGAGAVVIRDVPDFTTVVGCPARQIKYLSSRPVTESGEEFDYLSQIVNRIRKTAGKAELPQLLSEHKLQQDLGLDSLELAEMTVLMEAKFGVDVFEDGIVTTVQEVIDRIQKG